MVLSCKLLVFCKQGVHGSKTLRRDIESDMYTQRREIGIVRGNLRLAVAVLNITCNYGI